MAFRPNKSFRAIIDDLGLSTGLQLCLDAGDIASYPGSGQKWLDRAQGYDFFLGLDGTVAADDPTFNGTAGNLTDNEFWSFDGADNFTYDGGANEPWMSQIHQDGAKFTIVTLAYMPVTTSQVFCGNTGSGVVGNEGFVFRTNTGATLAISVANETGSAFLVTSTATYSINTWSFFAVSIDETGNSCTLQINGAQEAFACTYATPSSGPGAEVLDIAARGAGLVNIVSGARMGAFMMWNRALSAAEMMSLYQYPGVAFSSQDGFGYRNEMRGY